MVVVTIHVPCRARRLAADSAAVRRPLATESLCVQLGVYLAVVLVGVVAQGLRVFRYSAFRPASVAVRVGALDLASFVSGSAALAEPIPLRGRSRCGIRATGRFVITNDHDPPAVPLGASRHASRSAHVAPGRSGNAACCGHVAMWAFHASRSCRTASTRNCSACQPISRLAATQAAISSNVRGYAAEVVGADVRLPPRPSRASWGRFTRNRPSNRAETRPACPCLLRGYSGSDPEPACEVLRHPG